MAFTELIKNFSKTRDYMRDFYIYGFKARGDFTAKSARTYDDEKRRIESWLAPYIRLENDKKGKRVYVSMDTSVIESNPLYNAWKAKSFTDNDITLHFAILSALNNGEKSIAQLTDAVSKLTDTVFEVQTVRLKANELVREGFLCKKNIKKTDYYTLSPVTLDYLPVENGRFLDAVRFFQEAAPFGFAGSTILDASADKKRGIFGFKHHYIVHTLEDGALFDLLCAIHGKKQVSFIQQSMRNGRETVQQGIPLQVFISVQSGRRYVCLYAEQSRRFINYRMDYIKKVNILEEYPAYDELRAKLDRAKELSWGVSFGAAEKKHELHMKLFIDEQREPYILERLRREGRGGLVERLESNIFLYSITLYDVNEMMAWIKSFTGRIISIESTNREAVDFFYRDMRRMSAMYGVEIPPATNATPATDASQATNASQAVHGGDI